MNARFHTSPPSAFSRRVLVALSIGIVLVALVILVWYVANVLLLLFAGILVAILLRTFADWLSAATRLPDRLSLATVILILVAGLAAIGWYIAPRVGEQVDQLSRRIPQHIEHFQSRLEAYRWGQWFLESWPEDFQVVGQATGVLSTGVGVLFAFLIVLFAGLYLAADPWLYTKGLLHLVPPSHRVRARDILAALGHTLRWWLIGQLVAMTAVGIMTAIGLWALGVPLWLTLGLLAFLLDFVPYVGPIGAALPGVLIGLAESPTKGFYVIVMYVVVQQIESFLLVPMIQKRAILLPPVLTVTAQVLMWAIAGILGVVLATPLMAVAMILVKMVYVEEILGEELPTPDDELSDAEMPPLPRASPGEERDHTGSNHG